MIREASLLVSVVVSQSGISSFCSVRRSKSAICFGVAGCTFYIEVEEAGTLSDPVAQNSVPVSDKALRLRVHHSMRGEQQDSQYDNSRITHRDF